MVQFRSANLRDVVSRPALTRKPIYAPVENAFRSDTRKRIEQLNDFMQARASNQAGASAPTPSVRGELWADTSTAGAVTLYVDPDGEGFDDNIATRLTAKAISFKGPGTSQTFKPGGNIDVNTTQVSQSGAGDLMSYTAPGGTLGSDGQCLSSTFFGSYTGSNDNANLVFGAKTFVTPRGSGNSTKYAGRVYIIRTGAATQKMAGYTKLNRDDGVDSNAVENNSSNETMASSSILKLTRAAGTVTQEMMLTRYLP